MFRKIKILRTSLLLSVIAVMAGCEKKQTPPPPPPEALSFPRVAPPDRVEGKTPEAILSTLHHAAQEMALDGFQFDKAELGWPFDCGAPNSSAYLQSLAENGYLSPQDLGLFSEVEIANLSDSDPGETAFAKISRQNKIHLLRKDGSLSAEKPEATLSPLPARNPPWLLPK